MPTTSFLHPPLTIALLALMLPPPASTLPTGQDEPTGQEAPIPEAEDPYPPEEVETLIRFYTIEGKEVDQEKLKDAIDALGDGAALVYGPVNTVTAQEDWFVAIEAPSDVRDKEVAKAAKKGTGKVEHLTFSAFVREPNDTELPGQLRRGGGTIRDNVINMASEMRWFEATPTAVIFFYGKGFDAEDCADRFDKLAGRKPRKDYERDLVRHSVTWTLSSTMEVKSAKASKSEKAIKKLPGVGSASLDNEALLLHMTLQLADLKVSGPGWNPPAPAPVEGEDDGGEDGGEGGRGGGGRGGRGGGQLGDAISFMPRVNVNPIFEALAKSDLSAGDAVGGDETKVDEGSAGGE